MWFCRRDIFYGAGCWGIHYVAAASGHVIVRVNTSPPVLRTAGGAPFDLLAAVTPCGFFRSTPEAPRRSAPANHHLRP